MEEITSSFLCCRSVLRSLLWVDSYLNFGLILPSDKCGTACQNELKGYMKDLNISIYFFFPPITQWCSVSNVLFTSGREVSDFSVLKYY